MSRSSLTKPLFVTVSTVSSGYTNNLLVLHRILAKDLLAYFDIIDTIGGMTI